MLFGMRHYFPGEDCGWTHRSKLKRRCYYQNSAVYRRDVGPPAAIFCVRVIIVGHILTFNLLYENNLEL